eukprot:241188-Pelagomonas_calceolata.AAC.1
MISGVHLGMKLLGVQVCVCTQKCHGVMERKGNYAGSENTPTPSKGYHYMLLYCCLWPGRSTDTKKPGKDDRLEQQGA